MVDRDWRIFREDYEIYIKGGRVPPPIRKWSEANLPSELLDAIKRVISFLLFNRKQCRFFFVFY